MHLLHELSRQPERLLGEPAVYILRWTAALHPRELIDTQLGKGAAGDLFARMVQAESDAALRRASHRLRNSPEYVANARSVKKLEKALNNAERLQKKKARDRARAAEIPDDR